MSNGDYKKHHKPTKKSRYSQGYYKIINPDKYHGDITQIIYRSSYEYKFCRYCDLTEGVIKWASEPFSVKYFDPVNKKARNYHIDFYIRVKLEGSDKEIDYLVEVKPKSKLIRPIFKAKQKTVKNMTNYNTALEEFLIIQAKKEAAERYAMDIGYKFILITEEFLYKNEK